MDPIIQAVALRYRIASNVARRFAAVIDKAKLEQWKKDLRVMTKIYRDIPLDFEWEDEKGRQEVYERVWEAQKIFRNFRENFKLWVYKVVLPKREKSDVTYLERSIQKSAWDLHSALDAAYLFPTISGRIPDTSRIRNDKERNIKRYQTAATKVFKDLDEYLASSGGAIQRRELETHFEAGGVPVIVENWGLDDGEYGEEVEASFHKAMNQLRKWIDRIKGAGFGDSVKGLVITMTFDQKEWDTNGMYSPATDTLTLYPLAVASGDVGERTLTHEIGHRFYFKTLPGQARAYWEEVMEARGLKITKEDIHRFTQAVIREVNPNKLGELFAQEDLLKKALPAAKDLSDEVKFKELARIPAIPLFDGAPQFDPQEYVARLTRSKEGEVVHIEEITDYGNTNPVEAFAECFTLWILLGPRALGPWTQEFFKTICRAGGAKVASEHYTEVCGKCGTVISQCRCMSPNKTIRIGLCDECAGVQRKEPIVQWFPPT